MSEAFMSAISAGILGTALAFASGMSRPQPEGERLALGPRRRRDARGQERGRGHGKRPGAWSSTSFPRSIAHARLLAVPRIGPTLTRASCNTRQDHNGSMSSARPANEWSRGERQRTAGAEQRFVFETPG